MSRVKPAVEVDGKRTVIVRTMFKTLVIAQVHDYVNVRDLPSEEDGEIISRETIENSIDGGEAYRIVKDGEKVGGAVIKVEGDRGDLELLFVSPAAHGNGIGYAAWRQIEQTHPEVRVWETVTPYFAAISAYTPCLRLPSRAGRSSARCTASAR